MKAYLRDIILFAAIQLAIGLALFSAYPFGKNMYYASSPSKHQRLRETPAPRVVFIGGSGMAFGMDGALVKEALGIEPVNMGLHGALGVTFMLNEVRDHLQAGDLVVLGLEYPLLAYHDTSVEMQFMIEHRPDAFLLLEWDQIRYLMDHALNYLGGMSRTTVAHLRGIERDFTWIPPHEQNIFNEYGDVILHRRLPQRAMTQPIERLRIDPAYQKKLRRRLNDFHDHCRGRGVGVVFLHAPLMDRYYDATREEIERLDAWIRAETEIPVLNRPEELRLAPERFFDTPYHLWGDGIELRTRHVIDRIRPYLPSGS